MHIAKFVMISFSCRETRWNHYQVVMLLWCMVIYFIFMTQIVFYFFTEFSLLLSFYIDVVLTLSIRQNHSYISPRVSDHDMHHGTCVTHVPWCMPGSLTSGFFWSQLREKRSRNSRRMRNPRFDVSGKRAMVQTPIRADRLPIKPHRFVGSFVGIYQTGT